MGKRGPPKLPPGVLALRNTARSDRDRVHLVPPLEGAPVPPEWLVGPALDLFKRKVTVYHERGQSVVGLESALAHYCAVEAEIIDCTQRRAPLTAALRGVLIRYQTLFYDVPSAQIGTPPPDDNPFARNGRRPTKE